MPSFSRLRRNRGPRGFTILEALVALAILLVVMVVLLQFMTGIDSVWKSAAADPFAEADEAFETVVHHLAAATLAPYQDYADASGAFRLGAAFVPDHVARRSDLDFVCGPGLLTAGGRVTCGSAVFFLEPGGYTQTDAHAGLEHLLNAMGYFVEFGDDTTAPGFMVSFSHEWRWRLKEVVQPAESLQVFAQGGSAAWSSSSWIQSLVPVGAPLSVLAENVVALIVLPERGVGDSGTALAPTFGYDSRDRTNRVTLNQLPSRVRVALVAMDEVSALRLAGVNGANAPQLVAATLFQQAAQLDADLATLDASLTAQKIGHRIFQREILLPGAAWSNTPSP